MEQRVVTVDNEPLMALFRELLPRAGTLPLRISGSSMRPFLADRRDTVYLSPVDRELRVGDMVLYQRESGAYVLHRICRVGEADCDLIGDAQRTVEAGVPRDRIFGLVRRVDRAGRTLGPGDFWWEFFGRVWPRIIPLRGLFCRGWYLLRR